MDKENLKEYRKQKDKFFIGVHLKRDEYSIVENELKNGDWGNISGYIKYRLFGLDPGRKLRKQIEEKNTAKLVTILKNCVLDLAAKTDYFRFRYEKDMNQLYSEEGVDINKWINATNQWRKALDADVNEVLGTIRKIAKVLDLDDYFHLPSDDMHIDPKHPSQEEMDKLAEQLRIERKAMGYGDEL